MHITFPISDLISLAIIGILGTFLILYSIYFMFIRDTVIRITQKLKLRKKKKGAD